MTSVGEILRTTRESQGRAIAEVAQALCITQRYVSSIEHNEIANLPSFFFYKSFAKQYAAFLGMDAKLLEPGLSAAEPSEEPALPPETNARESWRQRAPIRALDPLVVDTNRGYFSDRRLGWPVVALMAVVLLCSGIYKWWGRPTQPGVAPAAVLSATPAAVLSAAAPVTEPVATTPPMIQPETLAVPLDVTAASQSSDVDVSATTDGLGRVVLNLSATEKTWLSITSNGKKIFSGFLEPSQSKTLTGRENATMRVGNAGGIDVLWNGKSIGPIGPRGQARTIQFTPENFRILSPTEAL
ncbi:MAG TPA: RodZ domain-containing protein [Bryobacteraceae bacterium]|nr:RodZ domain-containing protein [Bryobacteraceae bacterium]